MSGERYDMSFDLEKRVFQAYEEVQLLKQPEFNVSKQQIYELANNWKDNNTPALQRKVVDVQLDNLQKGFIDPVFSALAESLKEVKLPYFSLLDAACATGYYMQVIKALDKRQIDYQGCDYSEAMINAAKNFYPGIDFQVQDLTQLKYSDRSIDVILVSGVLEHIPEYQIAISEICRVARHYLIIHRCPLTSEADHIYTIGSQYNIHTPRIYFSETKLMKELAAQKFFLTRQIDIYTSTSFIQQIKSFIKWITFWDKIRDKKKASIKTRTLVFKISDKSTGR